MFHTESILYIYVLNYLATKVDMQKMCRNLEENILFHYDFGRHSKADPIDEKSKSKSSIYLHV